MSFNQSRSFLGKTLLHLTYFQGHRLNFLNFVPVWVFYHAPCVMLSCWLADPFGISNTVLLTVRYGPLGFVLDRYLIPILVIWNCSVRTVLYTWFTQRCFVSNGFAHGGFHWWSWNSEVLLLLYSILIHSRTVTSPIGQGLIPRSYRQCTVLVGRLRSYHFHSPSCSLFKYSR